jgi:hypothetical protein
MAAPTAAATRSSRLSVLPPPPPPPLPRRSDGSGSAAAGVESSDVSAWGRQTPSLYLVAASGWGEAPGDLGVVRARCCCPGDGDRPTDCERFESTAGPKARTAGPEVVDGFKTGRRGASLVMLLCTVGPLPGG